MDFRLPQLQTQRTNAGLSVDQLAALSGVASTWIYYAESNNNTVNAGDAQRLAVALNCTVADLGETLDAEA